MASGRSSDGLDHHINPGVPLSLLDKVSHDIYGSAYSSLSADERMIVGDKCSDEACLPLSDAPSNTDDVRGHQRGYHPGSELPDATVAASGQEKAEGGGAKSSSGSLAAKSSGSGNKAAEVMRQEGDSNRLA